MFSIIAIAFIILSIAWIWIATEMRQAIDITEEEEYSLLGDGNKSNQNRC